MANKSLFLTYFFWLFGGIFGLHHFYLGRDVQGFIWWSTLGGYIGGWLRDFFCIPSYVKAANHDSEYMACLSVATRSNKTPPFSTWRFCGMMFVSYMWGSIFYTAIPKDEIMGINWEFLTVFVPFAVALGVWCVGNIGHEEGAFIWPLLAAYGSYPLSYYLREESSYSLMVVLSCLIFEMKSKQWKRRVQPSKNVVWRSTVLVFCCSIYLSLWVSSIYLNGSITDGEGNEIPIREAIHHFFTSPWWKDLSQSFWDVYNFGKEHGWAEILNRIIEMMDPYGEQNAFEVLELDSGSNQTIINTRCRQLAVKWHPDRVKDPDEKLKAQEKFYQVQQACEILSTSKAKRRRKNTKSV